MKIFDMKDYILRHYQNASSQWRYKVAHVMSDSQIIAVYHSILRREEKERKRKENERKYHQITLFEWAEKNA